MGRLWTYCPVARRKIARRRLHLPLVGRYTRACRLRAGPMCRRSSRRERKQYERMGRGKKEWGGRNKHQQWSMVEEGSAAQWGKKDESEAFIKQVHRLVRKSSPRNRSRRERTGITSRDTCESADGCIRTPPCASLQRQGTSCTGKANPSSTI